MAIKVRQANGLSADMDSPGAPQDLSNPLIGPNDSNISDNSPLSFTDINNNWRDVYPVGSIYINATTSDTPNKLLGFGTWESFGRGRILVGHNEGLHTQEFEEDIESITFRPKTNNPTTIEIKVTGNEHRFAKGQRITISGVTLSGSDATGVNILNSEHTIKSIGLDDIGFTALTSSRGTVNDLSGVDSQPWKGKGSGQTSTGSGLEATDSTDFKKVFRKTIYIEVEAGTVAGDPNVSNGKIRLFGSSFGNFTDCPQGYGGDISHAILPAEMPNHRHDWFKAYAKNERTIRFAKVTSYVSEGTRVTNTVRLLQNRDLRADTRAINQNLVDRSGVNVADRYKVYGDVVGSRVPHNNLMPYVTAYIYRRTA